MNNINYRFVLRRSGDVLTAIAAIMCAGVFPIALITMLKGNLLVAVIIYAIWLATMMSFLWVLSRILEWKQKRDDNKAG